MSSFYSNLAQEDTKNTIKQMRVKNAIVLKKSPKKAQKGQFKKSGYSGQLIVLLIINHRLNC
jgi:hypothetical protein